MCNLAYFFILQSSLKIYKSKAVLMLDFKEKDYLSKKII